MYGVKSRLEKLIKTRDQHWEKTNDKIMEELSKVVFPAITMFMARIRGDEAAARVKFTSADIGEHNEYTKGVLVVWGNSIFQAGEQVVDDDGELVTITEQQARILSTPLQVTIPLTMVKTGNLQEIVDFLEEVFNQTVVMMKKRQEAYEQHMIEHHQNTPGDLATDYMYNVLNELDQPDEVPELDMDLSEFSEEEQLMIKESHKKNGGTMQ